MSRGVLGWERPERRYSPGENPESIKRCDPRFPPALFAPNGFPIVGFAVGLFIRFCLHLLARRETHPIMPCLLTVISSILRMCRLLIN